MTEFQHRPVLLAPAVDALLNPAFGQRWAEPADDTALPPDGVWVDGTFGRGGHSRALLARLGPQARLVVFDKDPVAMAAAQALAAEDSRVTAVHGAFGGMQDALEARGITQVNGVLLDVGVSSPQIDDAARGFSFMRDGPLDMRMDTTRGETAEQWLARASVDEMREVIASHGEERFAFRVAKAIAARRTQRPFTGTADLADVVAGAVRTREKAQHPATRTFQAIRIHINRELEELADALAASLNLLAPGGRLAVISFHSLEDRLVKRFIGAAADPGRETARLPLRESERPQPVMRSVARVLPDENESRLNPRARSAVLRVAERSDVALPPSGGRAFLHRGG